jgi:hypothetical protein
MDGDITTAQFRTKSAELEEARTTTESHIEAARSRLARLEAIKRDKDALISHYASLIPSHLQGLSPEERRQVYKMVSLRVLAHFDDTLIADWGCNDVTTPSGGCRTLDR